MRSSSIPGAIAAALLLITTALPPVAAWAQLRSLPTNAKRATLGGYQNPFVLLGGEQRRLAPGALIYDTHNRTILPGYLPASADVVYTLDGSGAVLRIYLLTAQEQQRLDQAKR
ncbi:MAG: hypothetical protein IT531_23855 [Burkholderiales bacterium]|nr:hypothetical protein [Burkholderiales bacterium]